MEREEEVCMWRIGPIIKTSVKTQWNLRRKRDNGVYLHDGKVYFKWSGMYGPKFVYGVKASISIKFHHRVVPGDTRSSSYVSTTVQGS